MTDDKKTDDKESDKVITLEDFKKTAKELSGDLDVSFDPEFIPDNPVDHILTLATEANLEQITISGTNAAGKLEFFSSCNSAADTMFLLEAFKKVVLDTTVGTEYNDDE